MSHVLHRRGSFKLVALMAALLPALLAALPTSPAFSQTTTRYIFTAFTNSSESNMYVYQSYGFYYIVYTNNWTGTNFGIIRRRERVKG